MGDKPHKAGPDALKELRSLDPETRRHIIGLFEQHTEGLIILIIQLVFAFTLISASPGYIPNNRGLLSLAWLLYITFSVFWVVRSIGAISREVYGSFTKDELRSGRTYGRYCEGRWFLKTVGGLVIATLALVLASWFI